MKKVPEDLAEKLLAASNLLPPESGFDVSVDEVARLAGVARATLYYYFSGKDDLVEFYMTDLLERTRVAIQKASASEGSTPERLEAVMKAMVSAYAAYPRMCLELPSAIKNSGHVSSLMASMEQAVMAPFREVLLEGRGAGELDFVDAGVATDAIAGALHMVSVKALISTGSIDVDHVSDSVVPQLIRGLLPR